ncbi:multifunctional tRNA nucleotidyl transferase/2'3'-cyclic phosphodiesterase/2'nucleotidase/phosphatase [Alteromonas mediterranea MED64]|uniref:multifunctional tRNA nucleotidyl transferase/2'3'-cyclic phosphodiesterase/2'nucleotidase/phosphatase n=1 Tax=Alteromonas mediterranea TaxID=314275 RepID=UPI0003556898|nr:multifunctional tRNA nucleotidyl transferase/2'3'-cyclic phosphodiesterase/2'nucleotidase/phosphatase [Alteromonas mediterranea]AGP80842.1 multifunctional tRNA nucleotidyl transferase/2'3'-cyclic phosphodiesterase/2'nucleotidase/phosphatase [Alteromonas mediterranea MED64]
MQVYLVGGAVRDTLLNRKVIERDYVVVGATPQEMLSQGFTQVGKDFPVFLHPKTQEEYALARTERKSGKGYTGFVCDASSSVTLEEDLLRRDLTVNAIAQDNLGNLIDPYGGKKDLENRLLRHVSEAFSEDPLRVFRVARFATRYAYLGFTIANETMALMQSMAESGELSTLSAERVWQETKRSLLEKTPHVFFTVLNQAHGLNDWFAELEGNLDIALKALKTAVELEKAENESVVKDTGSETPLPESIAPETARLITRFTALLTHLNEEVAKQLCSRLKVQNQVSEIVSLACKFKGFLLNAQNSPADLLALFNGCDAWRREERFTLLLSAFAPYANNKGVDWQHQQKRIENALAAANQVNVQDIISTGVKGPEIKEALNRAKLSAIASINDQ